MFFLYYYLFFPRLSINGVHYWWPWLSTSVTIEHKSRLSTLRVKYSDPPFAFRVRLSDIYQWIKVEKKPQCRLSECWPWRTWLELRAGGRYSCQEPWHLYRLQGHHRSQHQSLKHQEQSGKKQEVKVRGHWEAAQEHFPINFCIFLHLVAWAGIRDLKVLWDVLLPWPRPYRRRFLLPSGCHYAFKIKLYLK